MTEVLVKMIMCGILACECNRPCKIDKYLDVKSCSCKKHLFDKLILACDDEIISTTEISLDDIKATCVKSYCLSRTISLIIIVRHLYLL